MRIIMIVSFLIGCFVFWRTVFPLENKWFRLWGLPIFLAALKFPLLRLLGGPAFFAPVLPGWVILCGGWLYAALMFYFFMLLVYELIGLIFLRKYSRKKRHFTDICCHLTILVLTVVIVTTGVCNAIPNPQITRYSIEIAGLPSALRGMKIAVLADLHADSLTGRKRIAGMVERTIAENPDIIAIVGDFVDGSVSRMSKTIAPLGKLKAKYGVFGVAGNHEYYSGYMQWKQEFERLGIKMLDNKHVILPCGAVIAGVTDRAAGRYRLPGSDVSKALAGVESYPVIMLAHRPDLVKKSSEHKVALQLSGHTHGGMAPLLSYFVAKSNAGYVSGVYKVKDTVLVVSNGSGIWNGFPVRLGVPAEIVVVTLK